MPKIAVVIPLYNKGPHILRTLDSVRRQTLAPDEIIVVDDGSTDGGYEAVQGLNWPHLRLLQRLQPGPAGSAARNLGATTASSDWIALLDADDEWLPNHLEVFAETLAKTAEPGKVAAVFSGYTNVHPDGLRTLDAFTQNYASRTPDVLSFSELISIWLKMGNSPVWTSAVVVKRAALIEAGLFPAERCTRGEDKDTWLRVAHVGTTLPTKQMTAIYHRDAVNMATSLRYANQRPCIEHSITDLLAQRPTSDALLLQRLANAEIFGYAVSTTRVETLRNETWQGFYRNADPVRAITLQLLSIPAVSKIVRETSRLLRRR